MFVWEVAERNGITYEQVRQCFLVDYTEEDAGRFWRSRWEDIQSTWLYFSPIYKLFEGAHNGNVA